MHVLYEESGAFRVGTILTDGDSSLQVEAPHGKRSKIKASAVLLRFQTPAAAELHSLADAQAAALDVDFLWQCCGEQEFNFVDLAREYCGRAPDAVEAAAILYKLHSAPMYFYRKGKGRFRAAPEETLRAALAGQERKRQLQLQIDSWKQELLNGRLPEAFAPLQGMLLYRPDRNRPETKAVEKAVEESGLPAAKLFARAGAIPSSHDYHLNRFLFECFPRGTGFPSDLTAADPVGLDHAEVTAFSLDDASTTEIDDAFSVTSLGPGRWRIGIHIAAPALGFAPGSAVDEAARERLSTVYMPGGKITMLPPAAVDRYTLFANRDCPAVSLYLDIAEDLGVIAEHTRVERIRVAANLRHHQVDALDHAFLNELPSGDIPYAAELHLLWRVATVMEAGRGKSSSGPERPEYSFHVENDRVTITERKRGTPMDKLVAELMIRANSSWGRLLDTHGYAAIYRVQSDGKVRMTTTPAHHQGLGVGHYAWASSPLRRYVDLANQWQLLALLRQEPPPFGRSSSILLSAAHDFEVVYSQYAEFQSRMEKYWCLRWILQEQTSHVRARVVRENLLRLEALPLEVRVPSLPSGVPAGTGVELEVLDVDLIDAELRCAFRRLAES